MKEENIDLLVKKRSEEIRKDRLEKESEEKTSVKPAPEASGKSCVDQKEIDNTLYALNKVQKRSFIWKGFVLILVIAINILWFQNVNLHKTISKLEAENLKMMDMSTVYAYEEMPLTAEDFLILDERQLINADVVIKYVDTNIHYSNSGTRVYVPLESLDFQLESPEVTQYVKDNIVDINLPIMVIESKSYVDFEFFRKIYGLEVVTSLDGGFVIYDETYKNLVSIDSHEEFLVTSHGMNTVDSGKSQLINAVVVAVNGDLSQVMTEEGKFGYVKTKNLKDVSLNLESHLLNQVREDFQPEGPIHITWQQISSFKATPNLLSEGKLEGVSVISPTWFRLNINGIVLNESDFRYMNHAHDKGYDVWGLFSNDFNPSWTSDTLNSDVYRKKAIAQILFYASLYDLDGVNIDFENMFIEDKQVFTRFIAELSPLLKSQNVVLSIDVTVPGGSDQYSKVLDRRNLAKHVDYMMLMAYDEHWASSPLSGPVASIPWVEKGLIGTLEEVPSEKLLLGMPLYMRVWIETSGLVTSKSIGIKHLEGVIEDQDYEMVYDETNGVNYLEYQVDGNLHRIWVEDAMSIEKRIDFVDKYNLAGIATWSKIFATEEVWPLIDNLLKK